MAGLYPRVFFTILEEEEGSLNLQTNAKSWQKALDLMTKGDWMETAYNFF